MKLNINKNKNKISMEVSTQKSSLEKLESLKVSFIKSINEIENIFSVESLHTNKPIINDSNDSLIFFDTPNYNSEYLTDLIIEYVTTYESLNYSMLTKMLKFDNKNVAQELDIVNDLKGRIISQTKKTKIYYCQDENIYSKLFEKYVQTRIKTDKQLPIILTIKGNVPKNKEKEIFIDIETLSPLNYNTIMKNMILLYDYSNLQF